MRPAFSVCVYCGSRPGVNPEFAQVAHQVGQWIGHHQGQLVYGGGMGGLMGIVANAALQAGAQVVGIMPQALVDKEWANHSCTELLIVDSMHTRKRLMAERADAFLAMPGGIGTLEELFEVWTWRQLGFHDKPIGLLNTAGYFDPLLQFMRHSLEQQFLGDAQMKLVRSGSDPIELITELVQAAGLAPPPQLDQI
jgi:uncharacterized protein (TIGR00730 family)